MHEEYYIFCLTFRMHLQIIMQHAVLASSQQKLCGRGMVPAAGSQAVSN